MEIAPQRKPGGTPRAMMADERAVDIALGQRIKKLRQARRMTQTDLARIIGVTYQQIYKYEYGLDRIAVGRLIRIAAALSVSVVDLLDSLPSGPEETAAEPQGGIEPAERILLLDAYGDIADSDVRHRLRELIRSLSGHAQPARALGPQRRARLQAEAD